MFRSQRGPDPFVGEGRLESLLHGPFRRFVLSLSFSSLSPPLPFMIRFYLSSNPKVWFTMVPYAVCGLGIVVSPTLSVPPSVSRCFFLPFLPSRDDEERIESRRRERDGWEMKNRPLPPLFCEIVFLARRETSILRRISIQRPFPAPLRYQSLPLVRSRSTDRWISFVQIASQSTIIPASFPFHGWKGWTPADFLFRHRKNSGQNVRLNETV